MHLAVPMDLSTVRIFDISGEIDSALESDRILADISADSRIVEAMTVAVQTSDAIMKLPRQAQRLLDVFRVGVKLFFNVAPGIMAGSSAHRAVLIGKGQWQVHRITMNLRRLSSGRSPCRR